MDRLYLCTDAVLHSIVDILPVADTEDYDHRSIEFKNNAIVADAELPVSLQRPPHRQGILFRTAGVRILATGSSLCVFKQDGMIITSE